MGKWEEEEGSRCRRRGSWARAAHLGTGRGGGRGGECKEGRGKRRKGEKGEEG